MRKAGPHIHRKFWIQGYEESKREIDDPNRNDQSSATAGEEIRRDGFAELRRVIDRCLHPEDFDE